MRISDWSSDVCSSDLIAALHRKGVAELANAARRDIRFGVHRRNIGLPQPVRRGVDRQPGVAEPQRRLALVDGTSRPCDEIGRASGRERVCQYVSISGVAVSIKKKTRQLTHTTN